MNTTLSRAVINTFMQQEPFSDIQGFRQSNPHEYLLKNIPKNIFVATKRGKLKLELKHGYKRYGVNRLVVVLYTKLVCRVQIIPLKFNTEA